MSMLTAIRLQQFRSYEDSTFTLHDGVNVIIGPNASGKTNLLEGILVAARGGSYRVRDAELVMFAKQWARLDAKTNNGVRTVKIALEPTLQKTFEIEGRTFKRLGLQHGLPVVLFEPNHLVLLHGSPERRREYLDGLLTQTTPGYAMTLRNYQRTLAQRNRLLKDIRASRDQFFPWDIRLCELAAVIVNARLQLVDVIQSSIASLYQDLAQSLVSVSVSYRTSLPVEQYGSHMMQYLAGRLEQDRIRGFTSHGPHREDFAVFFDGRAASDTASRGEARTFTLALKILELQFIETVRQERPILLLDDVFSELDSIRRKALTTYMSSHQTFITTTDADVSVRQYIQHCNIVQIGASV